MNWVTKVFVKVRAPFARLRRPQTLTEYVLILAAVGITVFGAY